MKTQFLKRILIKSHKKMVVMILVNVYLYVSDQIDWHLVE